ncbi:unnamed protein product [Toxocara canis]|uniref:SCP domain-containing protein n=1 Tax=Toxocara canis TaxID=6265 RepID=A0A183USS8_TOXCA|nr:unnamed protein product [Toxocara canis]
MEPEELKCGTFQQCISDERAFVSAVQQMAPFAFETNKEGVMDGCALQIGLGTSIYKEETNYMTVCMAP